MSSLETGKRGGNLDDLPFDWFAANQLAPHSQCGVNSLSLM